MYEILIYSLAKLNMSKDNYEFSILKADSAYELQFSECIGYNIDYFKYKPNMKTILKIDRKNNAFLLIDSIFNNPLKKKNDAGNDSINNLATIYLKNSRDALFLQEDDKRLIELATYVRPIYLSEKEKNKDNKLCENNELKQ